MKKPKVIEIYSDNGDLSHYALINVENGEKLWSESPNECKAMGYPVKDTYVDVNKLNFRQLGLLYLKQKNNL